MAQRKVSSHTIASYRDTFRLLLQFAQKRLRTPPSQLDLDNLDASLIGGKRQRKPSVPGVELVLK